MTRTGLTVTLASASPRRRALLAQIGIEAIVVPSTADEEEITMESILVEGISRSEAPAELARRRAAHKASGARTVAGTTGLLAADTIVTIDGESLEKPTDREDARRMLHRLSGRCHTVITGVAFLPASPPAVGHAIVEASITEVTFASLSDGEIEGYLDTGEWDGVAGGYRIQGHAGAFVTHLSGSYTSVMGLPLGTVYSIIKRFSGLDPGS
jgi:septum formation protein